MSTALISYSTTKYNEVFKNTLEPTLGLWSGPKNHSYWNTSVDWAAATRIKPLSILMELRKFNSVLYVDSDATIMSTDVNNIDSVVGDAPMACVFLDHGKWYNTDSNVVEPLTGTMYFNRDAIPFLRIWESASRTSNKPDGDIFAELLAKDSIKALQLPIEWAYIKNRPDGKLGGIPCDSPIIMHHQASRTHRYA